MLAHKWSYKVGLHGLIANNNRRHVTHWRKDNLVINRRMTWYEASFEAPLGSDPVVVDLKGMGKGVGWVNGHNVGRYWPSYLTPNDCCNNTCDYRGPNSSEKCNTNCGHPTQRWYHVPCSFLKDSGNSLVLFEEFGGNPSSISFQTVVVGSVFSHVEEKNTLELSCSEERPISAIEFASFGSPQGACGSTSIFTKGSCDSNKDVLSLIKKHYKK
ncbi:unnamed protein product [Linum trigynum]|uniref:SUEL-type lectin domain-containing protein n=1 Tax=Linum trigynum TaxID=586398 RepID=A0AAV2D9M5_9ROSI